MRGFFFVKVDKVFHNFNVLFLEVVDLKGGRPWFVHFFFFFFCTTALYLYIVVKMLPKNGNKYINTDC